VFISCSEDDEDIIPQQSQEEQQEEPEDVVESIRYLALGDSYTIGQGVDESELWPVQLAEKLEEDEITVEKLEIIAQTGWRTSNLIDAVEANDPQDFNLVSLLIGVNNQFSSLEFDLFITEFNILLAKAKTIAESYDRIFVVSIPDYGVTPFGNSWGSPEQIAEELDMYNDYMAERCNELNIPFINITEISRNLGDSDGALASDNLHPSGSQYGLWVQEILPVVLSLLED
jgi:lysophospholipase L1-like esterase